MVLKHDVPLPRPSSVTSRPLFLTEFQDHSRIFDGRCAQAVLMSHDQGISVEPAVRERAVATLGVVVGTRILAPTLKRVMTVTIAGSMEAGDLQEEYWMGTPADFNLQGNIAKSLEPT